MFGYKTPRRSPSPSLRVKRWSSEDVVFFWIRAPVTSSGMIRIFLCLRQVTWVRWWSQRLGDKWMRMPCCIRKMPLNWWQWWNFQTNKKHRWKRSGVHHSTNQLYSFCGSTNYSTTYPKNQRQKKTKLEGFLVRCVHLLLQMFFSHFQGPSCDFPFLEKPWERWRDGTTWALWWSFVEEGGRRGGDVSKKRFWVIMNLKDRISDEWCFFYFLSDDVCE